MVGVVAVRTQQGVGHKVVEDRRWAVGWRLVVPKEEESLIGIEEEWRHRP
jgi:hypothetical protein